MCHIPFSKIQDGENTEVWTLRAVPSAHAIKVTPPCPIAALCLPFAILVPCLLSAFQTVASFNKEEFKFLKKKVVILPRHWILYNSHIFYSIVSWQPHHSEDSHITVRIMYEQLLRKMYLLILHITFDWNLKFVCVRAASLYLVTFLRVSCCSHRHLLPVLSFPPAASSKQFCAKSSHKCM